ncbi:hypothetical protein OG923_06855 [Streptomyces halstedii]|uniref:hypothetical protein n=1 Tax=Streptomyces halstedii TaxID=1944 RepID=UPI003249BE67
MENCLFLHYLIDPEISGEKRLARCAGLWRTDVEHMEKTARAFGPVQVAEVAKTKDYVLTALRDVGALERTNAQGRLIGYEVDGEKSGMDINITAEAKALPSHLPAPYRILSGAAHGRPWMTNRARMLAEDSEDDLVGEAATVMTAVVVVAGALETALKAWRDYFGLNLGDTLEHLNGLYRMFFVEAVNLGVQNVRYVAQHRSRTHAVPDLDRTNEMGQVLTASPSGGPGAPGPDGEGEPPPGREGPPGSLDRVRDPQDPCRQGQGGSGGFGPPWDPGRIPRLQALHGLSGAG